MDGVSRTSIVVKMCWHVIDNHGIDSCLIRTQERMLHGFSEIKGLIHVENISVPVIGIVRKGCVDSLDILHWCIGVVKGLHRAFPSMENLKDSGVSANARNICVAIQSKIAANTQFLPCWRGEWMVLEDRYVFHDSDSRYEYAAAKELQPKKRDKIRCC